MAPWRTILLQKGQVSAMDKPVVNYQVDEQVGVIRIDNPPVNALSHAVRSGLMEALQQAGIVQEESPEAEKS